jgi:uncharacterized protein (DUF983 family)
MTTHDAPSLASTIVSGILGRCPACGHGKMFSGYLTLAPRCKMCGLDYSFADSGDGPAVFVILVTGFIVVGAALYVEMVYSPPYWLHAALWGPRHPAAFAALCDRSRACSSRCNTEQGAEGAGCLG